MWRPSHTLLTNFLHVVTRFGSFHAQSPVIQFGNKLTPGAMISTWTACHDLLIPFPRLSSFLHRNPRELTCKALSPTRPSLHLGRIDKIIWTGYQYHQPEEWLGSVLTYTSNATIYGLPNDTTNSDFINHQGYPFACHEPPPPLLVFKSIWHI